MKVQVKASVNASSSYTLLILTPRRTDTPVILGIPDADILWAYDIDSNILQAAKDAIIKVGEDGGFAHSGRYVVHISRNNKPLHIATSIIAAWSADSSTRNFELGTLRIRASDSSSKYLSLDCKGYVYANRMLTKRGIVESLVPSVFNITL